MPVTHPLLGRRPARAAPSLSPFSDRSDVQLAHGRVHECCGSARRSFAMWLASKLSGPLFWITPQWTQDQINPDGLSEWIDPARVVFVTPKRPEDILWTMEEVLRSGAAAISIADLPNLPGLTAVRRMHLAAENASTPPIGLLLTPGQGGAPGVETRWHLAPTHGHNHDQWELQRLRARTAPYKSWQINRAAPQKPLSINTA